MELKYNIKLIVLASVLLVLIAGGIQTTRAASMWTANYNDASVTKILSNGTMFNYTGTVLGPYSIASDGTNMWVASYSANVTKVLPNGTMFNYSGTGQQPRDIAFDGVNMWTANSGDSSVTKILPNGTMFNYTGTGVGPYGIAFDGTNMWVTNFNTNAGNSVTKVLPNGTMFNYTGTEVGPYGIAFDGTNMWVVSYNKNAVTKVLPNGTMFNYTGMGITPYGIAFDGTNIWTANGGDSSVTKILPNGTMFNYTGTGTNPVKIAFDGTNMWVVDNSINSVTKVLPDGTMFNYSGTGKAPNGIAFDGFILPYPPVCSSGAFCDNFDDNYFDPAKWTKFNMNTTSPYSETLEQNRLLNQSVNTTSVSTGTSAYTTPNFSKTGYYMISYNYYENSVSEGNGFTGLWIDNASRVIDSLHGRDLQFYGELHCGIFYSASYDGGADICGTNSRNCTSIVSQSSSCNVWNGNWTNNVSINATAGVMPRNTWHLINATVNWTTNYTELYIDGKLTANGTISSVDAAAIGNSFKVEWHHSFFDSPLSSSYVENVTISTTPASPSSISTPHLSLVSGRLKLANGRFILKL